jgi:hypothetical protein
VYLIVSENNLTIECITEDLLSAFPELLDPLWNKFNSYYSLESGAPEETPDAYPVFEGVMKPFVFELLANGSNDALLARFFLFFEKMADSPDVNVSRDLLGIAIVDPLSYKKEKFKQAWKFMGPNLKRLAMETARERGWQENLPASDTRGRI